MLHILEMLDNNNLPDEGLPHRNVLINRYRVNPLEDITNPNLFKQRYRFSQDNIRTLTEMVCPVFIINNARRLPAPPSKLCVLH